MLTKIDKIIVIIIIVAALLSLPIAMLASSNANEATLTVFKAGKKTISYKLNIDKTVKIGGTNGGYCLLRIKKGRASITKSSCPLKICQKTGSIKKTGQVIVCAPMRLMFQIEGVQKDFLDAVNE